MPHAEKIVMPRQGPRRERERPGRGHRVVSAFADRVLY
jgi:hypothetical protein